MSPSTMTPTQAPMMAKPTSSQMQRAAKYFVTLKVRLTLNGSPPETPWDLISTTHAGARPIPSALLPKIIPGQGQHVKVKDLIYISVTYSKDFWCMSRNHSGKYKTLLRYDRVQVCTKSHCGPLFQRDVAMWIAQLQTGFLDIPPVYLTTHLGGKPKNNIQYSKLFSDTWFCS